MKRLHIKMTKSTKNASFTIRGIAKHVETLDHLRQVTAMYVDIVYMVLIIIVQL